MSPVEAIQKSPREPLLETSPYYHRFQTWKGLWKFRSRNSTENQFLPSKSNMKASPFLPSSSSSGASTSRLPEFVAAYTPGMLTPNNHRRLQKHSTDLSDLSSIHSYHGGIIPSTMSSQTVLALLGSSVNKHNDSKGKTIPATVCPMVTLAAYPPTGTLSMHGSFGPISNSSVGANGAISSTLSLDGQRRINPSSRQVGTGSMASVNAHSGITTSRSKAPERPKSPSKRSKPSGVPFSPSKMQHDPKSVIGSIVWPNSSKVVYRLERLLQSAIYGAVYLAYEFPATGGSRIRKIALKVMLREMEKRHRGTLQEDFKAELKFVEDMKGHTNILAFDRYWEDKDNLFIVMPFAEFEDLFEVLRRRQVPFSECEARWLFHQLLDGADFLHRRGIGFRDHSLENVLMFVDETSRLIVPKITDPGQAVRFRVDGNSRIHEMQAEKLFGKSFRPPEVYRKGTYNPVKVDVFCMGWMLFFTVTKHQLFDKAVDSDPHWMLLLKGRYDELLEQRGGSLLSGELRNLLWKMLHPNYKARPTIRECLNHAWFDGSHFVVDEKTILGRPSAPLKPIALPPGPLPSTTFVSSRPYHKQAPGTPTARSSALMLGPPQSTATILSAESAVGAVTATEVIRTTIVSDPRGPKITRPSESGTTTALKKVSNSRSFQEPHANESKDIRRGLRRGVIQDRRTIHGVVVPSISRLPTVADSILVESVVPRTPTANPMVSPRYAPSPSHGRSSALVAAARLMASARAVQGAASMISSPSSSIPPSSPSRLSPTEPSPSSAGGYTPGSHLSKLDSPGEMRSPGRRSPPRAEVQPVLGKSSVAASSKLEDVSTLSSSNRASTRQVIAGKEIPCVLERAQRTLSSESSSPAIDASASLSSTLDIPRPLPPRPALIIPRRSTLGTTLGNERPERSTVKEGRSRRSGKSRALTARRRPTRPRSSSLGQSPDSHGMTKTMSHPLPSDGTPRARRSEKPPMSLKNGARTKGASTGRPSKDQGSIVPVDRFSLRLRPDQVLMNPPVSSKSRNGRPIRLPDSMTPEKVEPPRARSPRPARKSNRDEVLDFALRLSESLREPAGRDLPSRSTKLCSSESGVPGRRLPSSVRQRSNVSSENTEREAPVQRMSSLESNTKQEGSLPPTRHSSATLTTDVPMAQDSVRSTTNSRSEGTSSTTKQNGENVAVDDFQADNGHEASDNLSPTTCNSNAKQPQTPIPHRPDTASCDGTNMEPSPDGGAAPPLLTPSVETASRSTIKTEAASCVEADGSSSLHIEGNFTDVARDASAVKREEAPAVNAEKAPARNLETCIQEPLIAQAASGGTPYLTAFAPSPPSNLLASPLAFGRADSPEKARAPTCNKSILPDGSVSDYSAQGVRTFCASPSTPESVISSSKVIPTSSDVLLGPIHSSVEYMDMVTSPLYRGAGTTTYHADACNVNRAPLTWKSRGEVAVTWIVYPGHSARAVGSSPLRTRHVDVRTSVSPPPSRDLVTGRSTVLPRPVSSTSTSKGAGYGGATSTSGLQAPSCFGAAMGTRLPPVRTVMRGTIGSPLASNSSSSGLYPSLDRRVLMAGPQDIVSRTSLTTAPSRKYYGDNLSYARPSLSSKRAVQQTALSPR